jgi:pimeloyl-ACP methyl ester carboxylesterase
VFGFSTVSTGMRSIGIAAVAVEKGWLWMETATSSDGTRLAYDRSGDGPPLILVQGAFNDRQTTSPLALALADFTVLNLDRRGRGASGDTAPYSVEREIEDVAALIDAAGGRAAVFGYSSGANLVVQAAAAGLPITELALYEPAYNAHDTDPTLPDDLPEQLARLVDVGDRGGAVELYQSVAVGLPSAVIEQLRHAPFRPAMEAIAHTLAYDAAVVGDRSLPSDLSTVRVPTLVIRGEDSPPFLRDAAQAVADALPDAALVTLAGQGHDIDPDATAAVLRAFFARSGAR